MTLIETDRLILRTWKEEDLLPFAHLNQDPLVMEFFPKTLAYSETEAMLERLKQKFASDGFSFMAAELKETNEFIGFIGLNKPMFEAPFMPAIEIGWRIGSRYWNKGYATEGAKAALEYGFQTLALKEIVSFTAEINIKSRRIMEKIGMHQDHAGTFDHPVLSDDHPLKKHVLYRIDQN
jgi:RimJ/RimL family protein N-acetyltransferase